MSEATQSAAAFPSPSERKQRPSLTTKEQQASRRRPFIERQNARVSATSAILESSAWAVHTNTFRFP